MQKALSQILLAKLNLGLETIDHLKQNEGMTNIA